MRTELVYYPIMAAGISNVEEERLRTRTKVVWQTIGPFCDLMG